MQNGCLPTQFLNFQVQYERQIKVKPEQIQNKLGQALVALSMFMLPIDSALAAELSADVFAKVGDVTITQREYRAAYAEMSRGRFYHGKPNEAELAQFQRDVAQKLVDEALLLGEAKRRKLSPDEVRVNQQLDRLAQRNAGNPRWPELKEQMLPIMKQRYEDESLRSKLEEEMRKVAPPNEKQLRKYYSDNSDKFTEPEQMRASIILLKVDPSEPGETWARARDFGRSLIKQLREEGADFAELAKKYSGDAESATLGGDMGYMHGGMLGGLAESEVKKLKHGEVSPDVVRLMEGMAIFKLTELESPKLSDFDRVKERAETLWIDAESERKWNDFLEKLRGKAEVWIDESGFVPLQSSESDNKSTAK